MRGTIREKRIIKRFALLPILDEDDNYIWLEWAYIFQSMNWLGFWENKSFVTKERYIEYKNSKKE